MPNMPSQDIADMLVDDAVGAKADTIWINKEPSDAALKVPDAFLIIYDTGGFDPEATGKNFDKPTVNIRVKGISGDYAGAQTMVQAVKASLHQRDPETKNSTLLSTTRITGRCLRPISGCTEPMHRKGR